MPTIDADGCPIHFVIEGPERAPVLMLSNSLGSNLHMWDAQIPDLSETYRVLRYDYRGHGRSGYLPGLITIERLGRDALAIMDGLSLSRVHWCGLSMGGMVGQWLAANAPERIDKLILSNTTCYYPDKTIWDDRIRAIEEGGLEAIADRVLSGWLTTDFREDEPQTAAALRAMIVATPVEGYLACCHAIRAMDHRDLLGAIRAPTLVIAGRHDPATPVQAAEFIRKGIPGASLTLLDAAHLSNVEQPDAFTDVVLGFLGQR